MTGGNRTQKRRASVKGGQKEEEREEKSASVGREMLLTIMFLSRSLPLSHMVVSSCWGHRCWSLNLAQQTGCTRTLPLAYFSSTQDDFASASLAKALILRRLIRTRSNRKQSLNPTISWFGFPVAQMERPQIYEYRPRNVCNTKSFHRIKLILEKPPKMHLHTHTHQPLCECVQDVLSLHIFQRYRGLSSSSPTLSTH